MIFNLLKILNIYSPFDLCETSNLAEQQWPSSSSFINYVIDYYRIEFGDRRLD